jgi:hypothetical protein
MTINFVYFCRKSTDQSWEGDEPSTTVAEEEVAPAPQAESEAPAAGTALPEASVVEGEYSTEVLAFPIE